MDEESKKLLLATEKEFDQSLAGIPTFKELDELKIKFLGRQGKINQLFKNLDVKSNPNLGKKINGLKNLVQEKIQAEQKKLLDQSDQEKVDVTIPGHEIPKGSLHVITKAIEEIEDIFFRLGFSRRRYPEVDTDWYYAEGLNIPKDHPARDDQETFYITDNVVLTAHTSNGQLHEMEFVKKPPIKMINISKTYRRQIDATHNPMFHQFEGLIIDEGINITHLVGVVDFFAKSFFGQDRVTRLRPHHFQFTEPSFEIDISCGLCHGTGKIDGNRCKVCKSGWLELGGAGMVHPVVLKNGGIDPEKYSGFAFGWGVERVLMMKSGINIPDLRLLYSDDIRFLSQF